MGAISDKEHFRRYFAADLEIQRFACKLRDLCHSRWPNLFRASNPAVRVLDGYGG
jgi:hypothetical protein